MDVRRTGYFGLLTLNGRNIVTENGTIMHIVAESLKALTAEKSRTNADGELEILLRVRNKPFSTGKENLEQLNRATEVEQQIEGLADESKPLDNESYEDFYQRLLTNEYTPAAAEFIACSWFGLELNPTVSLWLNDPKAIRFRQLNSRDDAYDAAIPSEYESLKNYVKTTYPEFARNITFRTA